MNQHDNPSNTSLRNEKSTFKTVSAKMKHFKKHF